MHLGIYLQVSQDYLACLKTNAGEASKCRDLSKLYLQCRMERYIAAMSDCSAYGIWLYIPGKQGYNLLHLCNVLKGTHFQCETLLHNRRNLMAQQDLKELGFRQDSDKPVLPGKEAPKPDKHKQGFVAGIQR